MEVRRLPDWVNEDNLELYHHGVKGQRWGVRRYQNEDGTLTPRGEKRLAKFHKKESGILNKRIKRLDKASSYYDKKYNKKVTRLTEKGQTEKAEKAKRKGENIAADYKAHKERISKELDIIGKYSLADFRREKAETLKYGAWLASQYSGMRYLGHDGRTLETVDIYTHVKSQLRGEYAQDKKQYGHAMTRKARKYREKAEYSLNKDTQAKYQKKYDKQAAKDKYRYGG